MDGQNIKYISAGGNRHPSAADWDISGLLAYGAGRNIALWLPLSSHHYGVGALLAGHTDTVSSIKFLAQPSRHHPILVSGSIDHDIYLWLRKSESLFDFHKAAVLKGHTSSVNCLAAATGGNLIVSGAADATVRVWQISVVVDIIATQLLQVIKLKPRFFPLTLALSNCGSKSALILAVGGTKSIVQVYVSDSGSTDTNFAHRATLTGHEGWIRSLDFVREDESGESDLLLASASQDKYIRLWRVHKGLDIPIAATPALDSATGMVAKSLSNKAHRFEIADVKYTLTFEALLLGHEDWIYTARWNRKGESLRLLSASADNSLAIWESDLSSSVWLCITRLGEISAQKGSTTATGSAGGFWIGLWSQNGRSVVSLGKTGSWRVWSHDADQDRWIQALGVSGHAKDVRGLTWAKDGSYLLSTSLDQTTRLHAEWRREGNQSWHEFARPQIHGYDLNCIDSLGCSQFISGADEKLLRVFDEPGAVALLLEKLCGISNNSIQNMPVTASIPVLGLSNKAVEVFEDTEPLEADQFGEREDSGPQSVIPQLTLDTDYPPLEDQLSRHTLWPEREKLYGHGYEISAVAASNDGTLVATACKASSIDHAVIRIFETSGWHEIKPPLTAHSLTVTCIRFSAGDKMLLSVGRDRQWTVFERSGDSQVYTLKASNPKAHTRMILSASWAPLIAGRTFVTAGRDKSVRLWVASDAGFECSTSIPTSSSVTSVDFHHHVCNGSMILAVGTESGNVLLHIFDASTLSSQKTYVIDERFCPSLAITQLAWRPTGTSGTTGADAIVEEQAEDAFLAIASEDSSLRIISTKMPPYV